jgi:hypothetical protein
MKKVFVSQPINGIPEDLILERRNEVVSVLKEKLPYEFVILNNLENAITETTEMLQLAKSLEIMSNADLVVFPFNYMLDPRCILEYEIAEAYGLKTVYMDEGLHTDN